MEQPCFAYNRMRCGRISDISGPVSQSGAALVISLVFLLVLTLVGITSMQRTTMQERMAGNQLDKARAFQAAEHALRACEKDLMADESVDDKRAKASSNDQYVGFSAGSFEFLEPSKDATPYWDDEDAWNKGEASGVVEVDFQELNDADDWFPPHCMFEEMPGGAYRITARAMGKSTTTESIVQATYRQQ